MERKQIGKTTIFRLKPNEFEDSGLKNQCLREAKTPYLAYVAEELAEDEELLRLIDCASEENCPVAFLGQRMQEGTVDYEGAMGLLSLPMLALAFPKSLVRETGAFNERLTAQTHFELFCRLAGRTNKCLLGSTEGNGYAEFLDENCAFTYAYMIRYHLNALHAMGAMERIFSLYCEVMQSKDLFSIFQGQVNLFLSNEKAYEKIARQTAPFVILKGDDTCYGVLRQFADDLREALADIGQAVFMVQDETTEYAKLSNMVCKGIVGFQSHALVIDFFQQLHGPKFQFWFDYPLHFEQTLGNLSDEYYILCQDADYAELIQDYFHTENAIQFPPGGIARELSRGECIYDVVFIGSYFPDESKELCGEERLFYDYMLEHPSLTFEQGLKELFWGGNEVGREVFLDKMLPMKKARREVIGYYRNAVVKTILEMGTDLHVYGESWYGYEGNGREHLVIHPQVTVEESLQELAKAKIGLNIMSWHKSGMTERIANIMLSGAVCLTEETAYLRKHMKNGEEIVTFSLDRLEELPDLIEELLADGQARERIAGNAYKKAIEEHTWKHRAKELTLLVENQADTALTVFVTTRQKNDRISQSIYESLYVGRNGEPDLGYLGDDIGENISDLYFLYGELTGLFWIWQNIDDRDYVGICHDGEFFVNSKGRKLSKREYLELLEQYDAIVPYHTECKETYYDCFAKEHNSYNLDAVGRALKTLYPQYVNAFEQAMKGHIRLNGNLFVTSLPVLQAYAKWLFDILTEASGEIDAEGCHGECKHMYQLLSEQMFYVFALAGGLEYCEAAVGSPEEE